ncbi:MFS transporter, MHS family, proline/betaine transporter [Rhizobiales bacterium GAS191]|nr:MFS transporter, MHS family, proline/betaine transporter [Rhizobiales bacterium GAS113]SED12751.1 MFS transporter, MHS family, proline/betaine transporter [Rhizobiales bacterium GAS191]
MAQFGMDQMTIAATATELRSLDDAALRRKAILSCMVGNFLEVFDFTIYGFLAASVGHAFFPSGDALASTLSSFATFGIGFIMRPLGGVVLGAYADRHGRKQALVISVVMMAGATAATGLIPSYASIGVLAPALLVLCRLVQGFSSGGEWGGAASFLVEYAPDGQRGYYGSWQQFGVGLGTLGGSLFAFVMAASLDEASMNEWGWRIPFLFGFILAPVGYYLRTRVAETPAFQAELARRKTTASGETVASPLRGAVATQRAAMLIACCSTIIWTVGGYLFLTFMPAFATQQLKLDARFSLAANTIAILLRTILTPFMGALSDRIGRKPLLLTAAGGFLVLSYPLFLWLVTAPSFAVLLIVQLVAGILMAIFSGPGPAMLCELFPTHLRTTSLSIGYNLAAAIFGGFAPAIATFLVRETGQPIAPVYYVLFAACISLIAISRIRDGAHRPLRHA